MICKCGTRHDNFGDHAFCCKKINKKQAHNIIRDSLAHAIQPALATAGYIRPSTKIDVERKYIRTRDILSQPFDISFDPDPTISDITHTFCPYSTIGADITIGNCRVKIPSNLKLSTDVISSMSALADLHLQKFERKKFKRSDKKDTNNPSNKIFGEESSETSSTTIWYYFQWQSTLSVVSAESYKHSFLTIPPHHISNSEGTNQMQQSWLSRRQLIHVQLEFYERQTQFGKTHITGPFTATPIRHQHH